LDELCVIITQTVLNKIFLWQLYVGRHRFLYIKLK